ncbi:hypothetical protein CDAR_575901 [Caerostris darwini]|uniref:Protein TIC 214 n=1 Tax=Caerostris darwini TaxID=1538125 RepID=A0AAV4XA30_9ARAC|nr:hypothetical protein CDAR_575901 [Caerostris darwini]
MLKSGNVKPFKDPYRIDNKTTPLNAYGGLSRTQFTKMFQKTPPVEQWNIIPRRKQNREYFLRLPEYTLKGEEIKINNNDAGKELCNFESSVTWS